MASGRLSAQGEGEGTAERVFSYLASACWECHGPDQMKGGLRLDLAEEFEFLVTPGAAPDSSLFRRMALPDHHLDAMPPGGPRADGAVLLAVMDWINAGADVSSFGDWKARHLVGNRDRAKPLAALREATGAVVAEFPDGGGLRVDFSRQAGPIPTASLQALAAHRLELTELSFARRVLPAAWPEGLLPIPHLNAVSFAGTGATPDLVDALVQSAPDLERLILSGTKVGDSWLAAMPAWPRLQRLALFATQTTAAGRQSLQTARPGLQVTGDFTLPRDPLLLRGPRQLLVADSSKKVLALLREVVVGDLETVWTQPIDQLHDLQWLGDGRVLFQTSWTKLVEVDLATGEECWTYDAAQQNRGAGDGRVEVHSFRRLEDGTTLIAESGAARLLFVDRAGQRLHTIALQVGEADPHHDTRLVRPTPQGTFLVAHEKLGVVKEYNRAGEVVWSFEVPLLDRSRAPGHGPGGYGNQVFSAQRLASGNTLIGTGNGHAVLEVDPGGEIVWSLRQKDIQDFPLAWITTVQVLRSGNLLIGNCHAGSAAPQLFEVTREKEVVATFQDFERFGNALSNALLIEDAVHGGLQ